MLFARTAPWTAWTTQRPATMSALLIRAVLGGSDLAQLLSDRRVVVVYEAGRAVRTIRDI